MNGRVCKGLLMFSCWLGLVVLPLKAQQPPPPPQPRPLPELSGFSVVPFSFGPPGARSQGMGGTFIALADDATAAEANPAGLTQLSRPEISVHGRYSKSEVEVLDINAVTALDALNRERRGVPELRPNMRIGNAFADDTRTRFKSSSTDVSFASFVKPYQKATFSIFYQQAANFSGMNTFEAYDDSVLDAYQTRQQLDLVLDNFGASVAYKFGPRVSIGASLRYSRLTIDAFQDLRLDYPNDLELDRLAAGASLEELNALGFIDQRIQREDLDDQQGELTYNVGLLVNPSGRWSLGLVYKSGGDFSIDGTNETFSCQAEGIEGIFRCEPPRRGRRTTSQFKVPDFLGIGLAWRATGRFRLALDANRITYSDLTIAPRANPNAGPGVGGQFRSNKDTTSLHFGLEYILFLGPNRLPVTLRAGALNEPDHDSFRGIDSEVTMTTFGFGLVFMESLQVDAAIQFGGDTDAGILSMVYRF
ncbi:MAG: outer membrane protein transport protein [Deltaproteobacteria bacterium]|nr:outer membrane protein transport protein [Deltaproteobacteria bacterium]